MDRDGLLVGVAFGPHNQSSIWPKGGARSAIGAMSTGRDPSLYRRGVTGSRPFRERTWIRLTRIWIGDAGFADALADARIVLPTRLTRQIPAWFGQHPQFANIRSDR